MDTSRPSLRTNWTRREEGEEAQWAHGFQSSDVEREVGGVVVERYGTPANMKHFEVCLRVDVVMDMVYPPPPPLVLSGHAASLTPY